MERKRNEKCFTGLFTLPHIAVLVIGLLCIFVHFNEIQAGVSIPVINVSQGSSLPWLKWSQPHSKPRMSRRGPAPVQVQRQVLYKRISVPMSSVPVVASKPSISSGYAKVTSVTMSPIPTTQVPIINNGPAFSISRAIPQLEYSNELTEGEALGLSLLTGMSTESGTGAGSAPSDVNEVETTASVGFEPKVSGDTVTVHAIPNSGNKRITIKPKTTGKRKDPIPQWNIMYFQPYPNPSKPMKCAHGIDHIRCIPKQDAAFSRVSDAELDDRSTIVINFDTIRTTILRAIDALSPFNLPGLLPYVAIFFISFLLPFMILPLSVLFLPVPILNIPPQPFPLPPPPPFFFKRTGHSMPGPASGYHYTPFSMASQWASNILTSDECIERISCGIGRSASVYGYSVDDFMSRALTVMPKNTWLKRIVRGLHGDAKNCVAFRCTPITFLQRRPYF